MSFTLFMFSLLLGFHEYSHVMDHAGMNAST